MFFNVISNKKLVMYHYCPLLSRRLESPRDGQQARSSNLVPQALNALFHSPHKIYPCTLLRWLAENQYPSHIRLSIILSLSKCNNVIAWPTFVVLMQMSKVTHTNIICVTHAARRLQRPFAAPHSTSSILPHLIKQCYEHAPVHTVSRGKMI